MLEDLSILESVIKTNQDAIIKLHEDQPPLPEQQTHLPSSHNRQFLTPTPTPMPINPPTIPPIPDPVPTAQPPPPTSAALLDRNFSTRRGTRLAVHMSILDMGAHAAPEALKQKWIQTSRAHRADSQSQSQSHSTSYPPLLLHHTSGGAPSTLRQSHDRAMLKDLAENRNNVTTSPEEKEIGPKSDSVRGGDAEEKDRKGGGWMKKMLPGHHHH
ncbi:MAG: hypothetical protein Q9160_001363 [Pyrenula sp. 1 TL-2023]